MPKALVAWDADGAGPEPDRLVAGGEFTTAAGQPAAYAASWIGGVAPTIQVHPTPAQACAGAAAGFSISVSGANPSYQWRRNLTNLANGTTASGSVIVGATTPSLSILGVTQADTGSYDCVVSNTCGSTTSNAAALSLCCYANCDGSTLPPVLNVQDFACFLNKFASADPYANCDGSTTPPILNVQDFACFLNGFAAGCP
jgi:hypothetical protein